MAPPTTMTFNCPHPACRKPVPNFGSYVVMGPARWHLVCFLETARVKWRKDQEAEILLAKEREDAALRAAAEGVGEANYNRAARCTVCSVPIRTRTMRQWPDGIDYVGPSKVEGYCLSHAPKLNAIGQPMTATAIAAQSQQVQAEVPTMGTGQRVIDITTEEMDLTAAALQAQRDAESARVATLQAREAEARAALPKPEPVLPPKPGVAEKQDRFNLIEIE